MVVNTASECGFTPQYAKLQELFDTYKDKGFVVIGFPSNDFGGQEPGTEQDIAQFCRSWCYFPYDGQSEHQGKRATCHLQLAGRQRSRTA